MSKDVIKLIAGELIATNIKMTMMIKILAKTWPNVSGTLNGVYDTWNEDIAKFREELGKYDLS